MSAKVDNLKEEDNVLKFTLTGVDVSYANGLRRVILSEIPIVCFKTSPYEENKSVISINTTRLNNELIKHRLSLIPVCIQDLDMQLKDYLLEIDVENKTDTMYMITSKDFKIKNIVTNEYLDESALRKIFPPFIPPNGNGEYFIDFARLRPRLSDEIPGERLKMTCEFSIFTAKNDCCFNVVGTCAYGCTCDETRMAHELEIRKQKWKDEGMKEDEIKFAAKNWKLLEGLRYIKKNSFDFIIQTVGIYENTDIIKKGCDILIDKFNNQKRLFEQDEVEIKNSDTTMDNCYDVILVNEDYTLGRILSFELYEIFYRDLKKMSYIGFKKMHPHDLNSVIKLAFVENIYGKSNVKQMLISVIDVSIKKIQSIKDCFATGKRKKT